MAARESLLLLLLLGGAGTRHERSPIIFLMGYAPHSECAAGRDPNEHFLSRPGHTLSPHSRCCRQLQNSPPEPGVAIFNRDFGDEVNSQHILYFTDSERARPHLSHIKI